MSAPNQVPMLFEDQELPVSYGPDIILREANGVVIRQRADNYFDATAMCRAYRKLFAHYRENDGTQEFLDELASVVGIPITGIVVSIQGGTPSHQGTWVHRRVAIHLACWCSPKCAVLVNGWIDDLLQGRPVNVAEARAIDPFILGKLFDDHYQLIRAEFAEQRQQITEAIEHAVKTHVDKPRLEFTSATRSQILTEWLRQNPQGLDPTGLVRIIGDDSDLIKDIGELHHMKGNRRNGFRNGLPVTVAFHRKLTADVDQVGPEWRMAKNAHKVFLDKFDAFELARAPLLELLGP